MAQLCMDKVNGEEALKSRFSYTCSLHHLAFMYLSKKACFVNSFALISSFNSLAGFWFLHKVSCFLARKYLYHLTLDQDDLKRIDFVSNRAKHSKFTAPRLLCVAAKDGHRNSDRGPLRHYGVRGGGYVRLPGSLI